jgi:replicative DNA helicase
MKYSFGVDAVFVDYIQLIETKGKHENRQREISVISRAIKGIAKELNIPVIVLSQLKREVDSRDNKRPTLSDIRESGSIEQDSDVIVFIYRPEVYGIQKWDDGVPTSGTAELIVGKFRNGETFSSRAAFIGRSMRFEKLSLDYNNKDSF